MNSVYWLQLTIIIEETGFEARESLCLPQYHASGYCLSRMPFDWLFKLGIVSAIHLPRPPTPTIALRARTPLLPSPSNAGHAGYLRAFFRFRAQVLIRFSEKKELFGAGYPLVWYILKQYSPQCRWGVTDIYFFIGSLFRRRERNKCRGIGFTHRAPSSRSFWFLHNGTRSQTILLLQPSPQVHNRK